MLPHQTCLAACTVASHSSYKPGRGDCILVWFETLLDSFKLFSLIENWDALGWLSLAKMSTIQNFKNFLRHGKQARAANSPPHAEPTTNVQNVHAHQQRYDQYGSPQQHYGISEPNAYDHKPLQAGAQFHGDFSAAAVDNRNVAAKAGDAAARAAGDHQKKQAAHAAGAKDRKADYDPTVIERIVAEERESKGKLPRYPGLDRYTLIAKMGDGAFSNVYRAKDNTGQFGEVAIKVVRKFEMNNTQVRPPSSPYPSLLHRFHSMLLPSLSRITAIRSFWKLLPTSRRFREIA